MISSVSATVQFWGCSAVWYHWIPVVFLVIGVGFAAYALYQSRYGEKPDKPPVPAHLMTYGDWLRRETTLVSGKKLEGTQVPLDGHRYQHCTFKDVTFTFGAHGACGDISDDCLLEGHCKLSYDLDSLRATLTYLQDHAFVERAAKARF